MLVTPKQLTGTVGARQIAVKRVLTVLVLLVIAGCSPRSVIANLEQAPQGKNEEVLTWTTTAEHPSSTHAVRVGLELDPARLMGWTGRSVMTRTLADVTITGPDGETVSDSIVLPITELREIISAGQPTGKQTYDVAGEPLASGFYRVEPIYTKVHFKAPPGAWTLDVRLRVGSGAATEPLKGIRRVLVDVRGPSNGLTNWMPQTP